MKASLIASLLALTALRVVFIMQGGNDSLDAYLAMCGVRPAVAYYDGPGGVPVSAAAGMVAAGRAALAWPLFALVATLGVWFAGRPLAGPLAAAFAAVLLNALPAFNQAATHPDASMPLLALGLFFFGASWRGLSGGPTAWWLLAGVAAAVALLFSYQALLLPAGLLLVLVASHRWRPRLRRPGTWLAFLPVLLPLGLLVQWNAANGWVHFITGTWQTATHLHPALLPASIRDAANAASPLVLLALLVAAGHALAILPAAPRVKFVLVPAMLAALFAGYLALIGSAGIPIGLLALGYSLLLLGLITARLGPLAARTALSALVVATALWSGFAFALSQRPAPLVAPSVVREIESLKAGLGPLAGAPVLLIAEHAPLASAVAVQLQDRSHALPGHPAVYVVESPAESSQFALWPRYDQFVAGPPPSAGESPDPFTEQDGYNPFIGASALFVTTQSQDDLPQAVTAAFAGLQLLAEITTPSGQVLRVFLCSDYQTLPL
jgi:hypothetical protein